MPSLLYNLKCLVVLHSLELWPSRLWAKCASNYTTEPYLCRSEPHKSTVATLNRYYLPLISYCTCYFPATWTTFGPWPLTQTFNRGFCKTLWAHIVSNIIQFNSLNIYNSYDSWILYFLALFISLTNDLWTKIKLWILNLKPWALNFKLYSRIITINTLFMYFQ